MKDDDIVHTKRNFGQNVSDWSQVRSLSPEPLTQTALFSAVLFYGYEKQANFFACGTGIENLEFIFENVIICKNTKGILFL